MHYSIHNPERLLSTSATVPVRDIAGRDLKARHPYELRVRAAGPSQHPYELRVRAPDPHYIRISYVCVTTVDNALVISTSELVIDRAQVRQRQV